MKFFQNRRCWHICLAYVVISESTEMYQTMKACQSGCWQRRHFDHAVNSVTFKRQKCRCILLQCISSFWRCLGSGRATVMPDRSRGVDAWMHTHQVYGTDRRILLRGRQRAGGSTMQTTHAGRKGIFGCCSTPLEQSAACHA